MKKLVLLAILAGVATFSLIILIRWQNKVQLLPLPFPIKKSSSSSTFSPESISTPTTLPATIQGSLSFPSEGIPENLKVCAQNLDTLDEFCTSKHRQNSQFQYGVGYQLQVSPGTYQVYAFLPEQPDYKAYYSEAVPCGLSADCTSHTPISISVAAGETINNIDPQDWYAPPQE